VGKQYFHKDGNYYARVTKDKKHTWVQETPFTIDVVEFLAENPGNEVFCPKYGKIAFEDVEVREFIFQAVNRVGCDLNLKDMVALYYHMKNYKEKDVAYLADMTRSQLHNRFYRKNYTGIKNAWFNEKYAIYNPDDPQYLSTG
jgi:hypothetical protein